ncbi:F-box only protein 39-like [Amphiura filiformis]|uniref:F-box only protein 39-like n=1 Tax=Amphiura filiformis TaxID=82378 RepID=UPI003B21D4D6
MDIPLIGEVLQIEDAEPEEAGPSYAVDVPSIEEESGGPNWGSLPDIAVTQIASYLLPWEKGRMGVTCQNWNRIIMSTPHLWRSAEMRFRGNFNDFEHVIYTRSVGRYLKNLYIYGGVRICRRPTRFQRTFTAMLHNLYRQGPVQLKEFSITELQFQHQFRNGISGSGSHARSGIIRSLNRFLRFQTQLERLDLSYATLTLNEGVSLIRSAGDRSSHKLKFLFLDDYFERDAPVAVGSEFANTIGRFQALVDLTLNYGFVTDLLLTKLGDSCRKSLEYIHIRTHRCDSYQHAVDSSCWHGIRQNIPGLRVKFTMNGVLKINDIQRLLVTSMPLESVHIYGHNDDGYHPDRTAKHLARHYHDTLRKVVIDVGPVYRSYSRGLISLVTESKLLRYLEIHGRVAWTTLREIFEHIDEEYLKKNLVPSLTKFHTVLTCFAPQEEPEAEVLVMEEFRPRFTQHNLDYEVTVDPIYPVPLLGPNPHLMAVFW